MSANGLAVQEAPEDLSDLLLWLQMSLERLGIARRMRAGDRVWWITCSDHHDALMQMLEICAIRGLWEMHGWGEQQSRAYLADLCARHNPMPVYLQCLSPKGFQVIATRFGGLLR